MAVGSGGFGKGGIGDFPFHRKQEKHDMTQISSRSRKHATKFGLLFLGASLPLALGALSGCGSAYSGVVGSSGLGAAEYRPAVYVEPGNEAKYEQVLQICRQAANNRQMTAAQESQLRTLTGAVEGTVEGAASGLAFANIFSAFEGSDAIDVSRGESAMIGAGIGLATSMASAFASGAETTAAETKKALLQCLKVASRDNELWQVLE